jgi:predicted PurR-regulated permease PerM
MENTKKLIQPLFLTVLILSVLLLLKTFLIPLTYGFLLAIILYPICKYLEDKKWNRSLAILISLVLLLITASIVFLIFAMQMRIVNRELPSLMWRMEKSFPIVQKWLSGTFGLSADQQNNLIISFEKDGLSTLTSKLPVFFSSTFKFLFNLVIIPIYTVLILYYRRTLVDFISSLIKNENQEKFRQIVSETIHMYFSYIKGMAGVYLTVGVLNSIGLLILGVDYAIVFGMVTAFMTIIPYIGIIVSSILPIAMIWAETDNILYPLGVIAIFSIVQYLEANLIFPYIVGKKIGLNMFVSIIAIILGGVLWGVSGMVLFLPFVAIAKIVFSHLEGLKPINKLLEV